VKKRFMALLLVVCAFSLVVSPAFAGNSSNTVNGYVISTSCSLHLSTHSIVKNNTSPIGSARVYYTYNGEPYDENVSGTSQEGRWNASRSLASNQNAYKATTTHNGNVVTAVL
jgi:hypothetical protein